MLHRSAIAASLLGLMMLSSCTTAAGTIEPIPGSITYGGQPRTKLTKSPIGSTFPHRFIDNRGDSWQETYRVAPDRSLELIARRQTTIDLENNR